MIWDFVKTYQALFGGIFGAGLGYLAKWFFDQWSAERAARRQFAQGVTKQISELAETYYWSLANSAGVLGGLMESYINNRIYHLMLLWDDRGLLQNRLDEIAASFARDSFYHFCHLIYLFDTFQFKGSNTYLLTDHLAGETCKRLYNTFIASLPTQDDEKSLDTLRIVKVMQEERPLGPNNALVMVAKLTGAEFNEKIAEGDLKGECEKYTFWIKNRLPDVTVAADSLRAYNELLSHELALLYKDWFHKSLPSAKPFSGEVAFDDWPNVLTERSVSAIDRAGLQSALLRPIGTPVSTLRAEEKGPQETTEEHEVSATTQSEPAGDDKPETQEDRKAAKNVKELLSLTGRPATGVAEERKDGAPPDAPPPGVG